MSDAEHSLMFECLEQIGFLLRNETENDDHHNATSAFHSDYKPPQHLLQHSSTGYSIAIAIIKTRFVPVICAFGLIGNALNLVVLTCDRVRLACDSQERTVHVWLKALSVSDFLLCACILPHGLLAGDTVAYRAITFQLVYRTYSDAVINLFILVSTWLTVSMANSRYVAICRPLRARSTRQVVGSRVTVLAVFGVCLVFSLPRFFVNRIEEVPCGPTGSSYIQRYWYLDSDGVRTAHGVYTWIYFLLGVSLPLAALAFCNIRLVGALRQSMTLRMEFGVSASHVKANHRITTALVTIALMYILLVIPGEVVSFIVLQCSDQPADGPSSKLDVSTARERLVMFGEATNVLQIINFSCNFVLYAVLNVHFRRVVETMVCRYCGVGAGQGRWTGRTSGLVRSIAAAGGGMEGPTGLGVGRLGGLRRAKTSANCGTGTMCVPMELCGKNLSTSFITV